MFITGTKVAAAACLALMAFGGPAGASTTTSDSPVRPAPNAERICLQGSGWSLCCSESDFDTECHFQNEDTLVVCNSYKVDQEGQWYCETW